MRSGSNALRASALVLLGGAATASLSCSAPSKGAIVLAISTDMQTPKDVDIVSVFVSSNSVPRFDYLGRVTPDGKVILPATLAVIEAEDPSAQVRIRVTAFQETQPRVLRDVLTKVPHGRTALLRLPLDFLDVGSVRSGALPYKFLPDESRVLDGFTAWDPTDPTNLVPECDFTRGLTMIAGKCAVASVDPSSLPDYDPALVFGDAGLKPSGTPGGCFDVPRCFQAAVPAAGLDTTACTFPLPQGADPASLNVAVVTASTGACLSTGQCFVPLENDATLGWTAAGTTVTLAPGVCTKFLAGGAPLGPAQIYVSAGACAARGPDDPVCQGAGGDAGGDANAGGDAGASGDAGPGGGADATLDADAGDSTITVDSPVAPPSCEGGLVACGAACVDLASDVSNCGACGAACSGTCSQGRCRVQLLAENNAPYGVARDATNVYWTDLYEGTVKKRPIAGGTVTVLATGLGAPAGIAVDSSNVYWTEGPSAGQFLVKSVPIGGGQPAIVAQAQGTIGGLALTPGGVYWTAAAGACPSDGGSCPGAVMRAALDGGAPVTLATVQGTLGLVATDATHLYTTADTGAAASVVSVPLAGGAAVTLTSATGTTPGGIAVQGSNVYFGTFSGSGTVSYVPVDGGAPSVLAAQTPGAPTAITVDATSVYWGTAGGMFMDGVFKAPLAGGAATTLVATGQDDVEGIAVDSTSVYWSDFGGGNLLSVPIGGGSPSTIAAGARGMNGLAVSGQSAYVTFGSGAVASVPIGGGTPTTLAVGQPQPAGIAVDSTRVYWDTQFGLGAILAAPLGGGAPATIANTSSGSTIFAINATTVTWLGPEGILYAAPLDGGMPMGTILSVLMAPASAIAVDTTSAYWGATLGSPVVVSAPLDGGGAMGTMIASSPGSVTALAVNASSVYWTSTPGDAGAVFSVPLGATIDAGPAPTALAAGNNPLGIAVDSTAVYWTDPGLHAVLKVPLGGGTPTTVASAPNPGHIAVDGTSVYFIDNGSSVWRVTPK
jgi:hypothetical protein